MVGVRWERNWTMLVESWSKSTIAEGRRYAPSTRPLASTKHRLCDAFFLCFDEPPTPCLVESGGGAVRLFFHQTFGKRCKQGTDRRGCRSLRLYQSFYKNSTTHWFAKNLYCIFSYVNKQGLLCKKGTVGCADWGMVYANKASRCNWVAIWLKRKNK